MAEVKRITGAEVHEAVSVLCDAFQDYPVMRFVLGSEGNYVRRLYTLVGFFVAARVFRDEPVLGIREPDGRLAAAAIVSLPGEQSAPEGLAVRREEVWAELGQAELRSVRCGVCSIRAGATTSSPEHDWSTPVTYGPGAGPRPARDGAPNVRRR